MTKLILVFLVITFCVFAENLYNEYKDAQKNYMSKKYVKAYENIKEVMEKYPEYEEGQLLYFKIIYDGFSKKDMKYFNKLKYANESIKIKLLRYLIKKGDIKDSEKIYDSLTEKRNIVKKEFLNFLFKAKKYTLVADKYKDFKLIQKIEAIKNEADEYYYQGLKDLKANKVNAATVLFEKAIKLYPENYVYYLKLGQVYADNKNYNLSEYYFKKALSLNRNNDVYLNLFRIYKEIKNYSKLYDVSRYIISFPEVTDELARLGELNLLAENSISILKLEGQKVYVNKKLLTNFSIGNTYFLAKEKEVLKDNITGEKLAILSDKIARIRMYKLVDNVAIFYIIEKYTAINPKVKYLLY